MVSRNTIPSMAFNKKFPFYEKLTLKCQWLHKEKLGRICNVQKSSYTIQFWEEQLPAKLSENFYIDDLKLTIVGDYVTFMYNPKGEAVIIGVWNKEK